MLLSVPSLSPFIPQPCASQIADRKICSCMRGSRSLRRPCCKCNPSWQPAESSSRPTSQRTAQESFAQLVHVSSLNLGWNRWWVYSRKVLSGPAIEPAKGRVCSFCRSMLRPWARLWVRTSHCSLCLLTLHRAVPLQSQIQNSVSISSCETEIRLRLLTHGHRR